MASLSSEAKKVALDKHLKFAASANQAVQGHINRLWSSVNYTDITSEWDRLYNGVRNVIHIYGGLAAAEAVAYYDLVMGGGTGIKPAQMAKLTSDDEIKKTIRSSLTPLWKEGEAGAERAGKNLASSAGQLALDPGRRTILDNVRRDGIRYARVPQGASTCAWCIMLASRGAVYHTEETAGRSGHVNCDCALVPLADGEEPPEATFEAMRLWDETGSLKALRAKLKEDSEVGKVVSVKDEMLAKATPGVGEIATQLGAKPSKHEIEVAYWLKATFGGRITHQAIRYGVDGKQTKTPDYIWSYMWGEKEIEAKALRGGIDAVDGDLRKIRKQSKRDRFGLIDIKEDSSLYENITQEDIDYIKNRMKQRDVHELIIKRGDELIEYFTYNLAK